MKLEHVTKENADYVAFNADRKTVICEDNMLIAVKNDGRVYYTSDFSEGSTKQLGEGTGNWEDIIAITSVSAMFPTSVCSVAGLRANGSVVICGLPGSDSFTTNFFKRCREWRDIVAICGTHRLLVGLKRDGTMVAVGDSSGGQCAVRNFSDIVQIGCGKDHTVGLRSDGTVMATGWLYDVGYVSPMGFIGYETDDPRRIGGLCPACLVQDWRDIEEIRVATGVTFGRRSDGVWLEAGMENKKELKDDIYSIKLDNGLVARLRSDGNLEVDGCTSPELSKWTDIRLPETARKEVLGAADPASDNAKGALDADEEPRPLRSEEAYEIIRKYLAGDPVPESEIVRCIECCLATGNRTQKDLLKQNAKEVVSKISTAFIKQLAEQGNTDAQFFLGFMYADGRGVERDYAKAEKWYRKAAEQGDAYAQFYLGFMYLYNVGVAQDNAEAVRWYRKAAEQGHAIAQFYLGVMYEDGRGVAKDLAEAERWYQRSAEQGNESAEEGLERVRKALRGN